MKHYIIFFFVLSFLNLSAQDWQSFLSKDSTAGVVWNVEVKDDTIYCLWNRYDTVYPYPGITVVKMDSTGKVKAELSYFIDSVYLASTYNIADMYIDASDRVTVYCTGIGRFLILIFFDFKSGISWSKKIVNFNTDVQWVGNSKMLVTPAGMFLTGMVQRNDTYGTQDVFVIKTDLDGNEVWRKTYGQTGIEELAMAIVQKNENEIVIGANRQTAWFDLGIPDSERQLQIWIFGIDSIGDQKWEWVSNSNQKLGLTSLFVNNGHYIYSGREAWWDFNQNTWTTQSFIETRSILDFLQKFRTNYSTPQSYVHNLFRASTLSPDSQFITLSGYYQNVGYLLHLKMRLSDGQWMFNRSDTICLPNEAPLPSPSLTSVFELDLYDIASLSSGSTVSSGFVDAYTTHGWRIYGYVMKTNAWGADLLDDCSTVSSDEPYYTIEKAFVYPNPASDHITVQAPSYTGAFDIRLHNSVGMLMHEQHFGPGEQPQLKVAHLAAGLYFVQVVSKQGVLLAVGKVVVEH
jgi:hypothetical protein